MALLGSTLIGASSNSASLRLPSLHWDAEHRATSSSISAPETKYSASSTPNPAADAYGNQLRSGAKAGISVGLGVGSLLIAVILLLVYHIIAGAPTARLGLPALAGAKAGDDNALQTHEARGSAMYEVHGNPRPEELLSFADAR
ncbi:hypothetical protein DL766_001936 [Monosporascus sp. MC13-8B]|uniref:Uncharacterized protein n=1 Tax=Monosporascus cannonballus TaxID=155416 RepID=A0ABY0HJ10_9PEZI|nr:hypothetical protein DL762_000464 [Monosporascus cannonballus]RYO96157.1 hypothetical protein DL763_003358 [Monosporascus cannonballus]RYP36560.1 hypothetical protein DL766_001936 [Monosporascus sp. MC13-8B]